MVAEDDGGRVGAARGGQPILDAGDDGLGHPLDVGVDARHGLAQAYQESHVGIFLHEGGDAFSGVVGYQWSDGTVAVLGLDAVMVGEGLRYDDVVEHLYHADAPALGLGGEKREHLLVLEHRRIIHLRGEGIVVELHQRGEGVPVPQIHRVHVVRGQHVEVSQPEVLVVEPREVLGGVGVFVHTVTWQVDGFLESYAGTAQLHLGHFSEGGQSAEGRVGFIAFQQLVGAIDGAAAIIADDGYLLSFPTDGETFGLAFPAH